MKNTYAYPSVMIKTADIISDFLSKEPSDVPCPDCKGQKTKDGNKCPTCQGTGMKLVSKRRPVENIGDIMQWSEILKVILPLPKYQKMISDLQNAASRAISGIVNVITRDEAKEVVEAIVKSAFPPETGLVYGGKLYGHIMDTNEWGKDTAEQTFQQVLRGNPAFWNREDARLAIEQIKAAALKAKNDYEVQAFQSVEHPEASVTRTEVGAKSKQEYENTYGVGMSSVFGRLYDQLVEAAKQAKIAEQGGAGGEMIMGQQGAPAGKVPQTAEEIEAAIIDAYVPIDHYDRVIENVWQAIDDADPYSGTKSDLQRFNIQKQIRRKVMDHRIDALKSRYPAHVKDLGLGEKFDGSGFLDFDYSRDMKRKLDIMRSLTNTALVERKAQQTRTNTMVVYKANIDDAKRILQSMSRTGPAHIRAIASSLMNFLNDNDAEDVYNSADFRKAVEELISVYNSQKTQRMLILDSVDSGGLAKPPAGHPNSPPVFNAGLSEFLSKNFVPLQKNENRKIVFISAHQLDFPGVEEPSKNIGGGVKYFDFSNYPVDAQEAEVLVRFYRSAYERKWRAQKKSAQETLSPDLSKSDYSKITKALLGKTIKQAQQMVKDGFDKVMDLEAGGIDGQKLYSEMIRSFNDSLVATSKTVGTTPSGTPMSAALAPVDDKKLKTFERYVRDPNTPKGWGAFVERQIGLGLQYRNAVMAEEYLRSKKQQIEKDNNERLRKKQPIDVQAIAEIDAALAMNSTEQETSLSSIPSFTILFGPGSSGKSYFAEAFAKLLEFQFYSANLSLATGGLKGDTEHLTEALLKNILRLSDAVVRIDELDKQLPTTAGGQHDPAGAAAVGLFLSNLEDSAEELSKRRVFVIATCNNPNLIVGQIKSRASMQEAESIQTEAGYTALLRDAAEFMTREGKVPLCSGTFGSPEEALKTARQLWSQLDHAQIAKGFVQGKSIATPRYIHREFVPKAFEAHNAWLYRKRTEEFLKNKPEEFRYYFPKSARQDPNTKEWVYTLPPNDGFEMNTENLYRAATMTQALNPSEKIRSSESYQQDELVIICGVGKLRKEVLQKKTAEEVRMKDETAQTPAPGAGVQDKTKTQPTQQQPPAEEKAPFNEMDVEELVPVFPPRETPPSAPAQPQQAQQPEENPAGKQKKDTGKKKSSTDYYYEFLRQAGIVKDESAQPEGAIEVEAKKKSARQPDVEKQPSQFSLGMFGKAMGPDGVPYDDVPPYFGDNVQVLPCKLTLYPG